MVPTLLLVFVPLIARHEEDIYIHSIMLDMNLELGLCFVGASTALAFCA